VAKRQFDPRWVSTVLRVAVGGVFIFSGYTKILDIDETIRSVRNYQLLPEAIVPTVGSALPILELLLAVLLIAGLLTRVTAAVTFLLSLAFFIGVASAWARGLQIECGCFNKGGELAAGKTAQYLPEILRDVGFLVLAGILLFKPRSRFSVDGLLMGEQ
jgi:uncharacterized membrane protein YphA (DoxX/SURF4 family)